MYYRRGAWIPGPDELQLSSGRDLSCRVTRQFMGATLATALSKSGRQHSAKEHDSSRNVDRWPPVPDRAIRRDLVFLWYC